MAPPKRAKSSNDEGRIVLAKLAIKSGQFKSIRAAAESYDVKWEKLRDRLNGIPSRDDCTPNSRKLTLYEEEAIIQYILDLDSRGFSLTVRYVGEIVRKKAGKAAGK